MKKIIWRLWDFRDKNQQFDKAWCLVYPALPNGTMDFSNSFFHLKHEGDRVFISAPVKGKYYVK